MHFGPPFGELGTRLVARWKQWLVVEVFPDVASVPHILQNQVTESGEGTARLHASIFRAGPSQAVAH
jgi:hypothetical protein